MLRSINYCMCVFLKFICIYFFQYQRAMCQKTLNWVNHVYLPSQNKEHCIVLYCIVLVPKNHLRYLVTSFGGLEYSDLRPQTQKPGHPQIWKTQTQKTQTPQENLTRKLRQPPPPILPSPGIEKRSVKLRPSNHCYCT